MTGKQLMNLLNQLTEEELQRDVLIELNYQYPVDLNSVALRTDPLLFKSILLRELRVPYPDKVIRPTRRAAQRIKKAKKQGGKR